jgi:hypothetical protein
MAWEASFIANLPLLKNVYLQSGFAFGSKGGNSNLGEHHTYYGEGYGEIDIFNLQLSLTGFYCFPFSKNIKLELGLGYYWAYMSADNFAFDVSYVVQSRPGWLTTEYDDQVTYSTKSTDFGMTLRPQLRLKKFVVGIQYDLGFKNILNDQPWASYDHLTITMDPAGTARTRRFLFVVGYDF